MQVIDRILLIKTIINDYPEEIRNEIVTKIKTIPYYETVTIICDDCGKKFTFVNNNGFIKKCPNCGERIKWR